MLNKKKRMVTMLCAAAAALALAGCGADAGAYLMSGGTEDASTDGSADIASAEASASGEVLSEDATSAESVPDTQPETEEDSGMVLVYVCGQVNTPGVYELPAGSRVCDALDAADGMSDEACGTYWNLAEALVDGQMLYFPTDEEVTEGGITALDVAEASGSGVAAASSASASGGSTDDGGLVNINTATLEQLETIPGIGEAKGKAIIAYREEHGDFASTDAIVNVSGIGDATYQNMKDYITVG